VLVDRFADGMPDPPGTVDRSDPQAFHGGDLRGVLDRLDHIRGMGFGAVWLSPITSTRTEKIDEWGAFHGYWVSDLKAIEPRFGTLDEARAVADALRERDMGLYLDMVYNHVGYDTPRVSSHPAWFHDRGDIVDWNDDTEVRTHDVHGLPDLDQDHPEVYAHLLDASLHWIRALEPRGFRVDAVRHLDAGFLAHLGRDVRAEAGDDFEFLGEVFEGDPARLARTQSEDDLSAVFDFPLHYAMRDVFCEGQPLGRVASTLALDTLYGSELPPLVTFLDNHDRPRIGDCERAPLALAFLLTARGRPAITYGTEIRSSGAEEPANRGDMVFGLAHPMESDIRTWLHLRAISEAVRSGRTVTHELEDHWLLQSRQLDSEALLVAVNLGNTTRTVDLGAHLGEVDLESSWRVEETTQPIRVNPGRRVFEVGPQSMRVWRTTGAVPSPTARSVPVEIRVKGAPPGAAVLVGAGDLGGWDPSRGVPGRRGPKGVLHFTLQRPVGGVIAYKIAITGDETTWEERPNRYHLVGEGDALELVWGH